jgi:DNA invertase Pin-like site-specific DNA recombinase
VNAFIYARYSSHSQKDASIEQQFREIREYCSQNNITVIGEYADHAISGTTDKRPEFQRMIADAKKKTADLIVCWRVDRFARNRDEAAMYRIQLKRHGVKVAYAMEPIPEGAVGVLIESTLEGFAEFFSTKLGEDIRRGLKDNAVNCLVNGNIPIGYARGLDGKFEVDPAKASIVREAFESYAAGMNTQQIVNSFNARGLQTKRGAAFTICSLRSVLHNERYTGVYKYNDVRVEDGCPAIVSKELFDMVQKKISDTARAPASSWSRVSYLLTGKLFCGLCGHTMIGDSAYGKGNNRHYYYVCSGKKREKSCSKKRIRKDWIEYFVSKLTVEYILVDDVIEKLADAAVEYQARERDHAILDSLNAQRKETEKSIKNLLSAIERGIITPTTGKRMKELEGQLEDITAAISRESVRMPMLSKEMLIYWMERYRSADLGDEQVRWSIFESFVSQVYVYEKEVPIVYKYCGEQKSITREIVDRCGEEGCGEVFGLDAQRYTF